MDKKCYIKPSVIVAKIELENIIAESKVEQVGSNGIKAQWKDTTITTNFEW